MPDAQFTIHGGLLPPSDPDVLFVLDLSRVLSEGLFADGRCVATRDTAFIDEEGKILTGAGCWIIDSRDNLLVGLGDGRIAVSNREFLQRYLARIDQAFDLP